MNYYEVYITMTAKPMGRPKSEAGYSDGDYHVFARDTKKFKTLEEVKAWLKDHYGNSKRVKMYQDTEDGAQHTGYIYCFIGSDYSHSPVDKWYQQDWVEISEVTSRIMLVR